jgi:transcriptional regulator with XRE-family HTH domain
MSEQETFGPRLRRERERRGISLETLSVLTNVSVELWIGLESNDFSKWPRGLFARAFVRDYARAIGLDAAEVVDDFCRLFPLGDRRAMNLIRAQAELIGHDPQYRDDPALIPGRVDRRAGPEPAPDARPLRRRWVPRILAAIFHT